MDKCIFLLWDQPGTSPAERRLSLLERCGPALLALDPAGLQINICDDLATTPSPAPKPLFSDPFVGQVNVWLNEANRDQWQAFEDVLRKAGFQLQAYLVEEWLYTDYGEHHNVDAAYPRSWPDGERCPGILAVTLLRKPRRLNREVWLRRWFGHQSQMSERMQPRARYVRHLIQESLSPGAEQIDGLVEEDWPSGEHVTNLKLFYGARNWWGVMRNMAIMLHSVVRILNLFNITTVMMSAYFIKTPPGHAAAKKL
ncbi:MAG: hypothetical protein ACSHXK_12455 [Oceanococcus sp.]